MSFVSRRLAKGVRDKERENNNAFYNRAANEALIMRVPLPFLCTRSLWGNADVYWVLTLFLGVYARGVCLLPLWLVWSCGHEYQLNFCRQSFRVKIEWASRCSLYMQLPLIVHMSCKYGAPEYSELHFSNWDDKKYFKPASLARW